MFQRLFRILNCEKLNFGIHVEDLARDKLTACSVFQVCVKDRAVKIAEMSFFLQLSSYHGVLYKYPLLKIKNSS